MLLLLVAVEYVEQSGAVGEGIQHATSQLPVQSAIGRWLLLLQGQGDK
jgi:hypothetical protein